MNHKMLLPQMTGLTLALVLLVACGTPQPTPTPAPPTAPPASIPPTATPTSAPTSAASPSAGTEEDQFTDPFTYCAAVGTIDAPDERYTGPEVPEEIIGALREEAKISDDAPTDRLAGGTFWRCMDSKVWACFIGANLPCYEADTSQTPSPEMKDFCEENPNSDFIPAAVTGHGTIYEWRCTDGEPEIAKQVFETDAQGFVSDFWYELSPPAATPEAQIGFQPLSSAECSDLADAMAQMLGIDVTTTDVPIERSWNEQTGSGCQMTAVGNGLNFDSLLTAEDMTKALLQNRGWSEKGVPICLGHGGWGPTGATFCFTKADKTCEAFVRVEPSESELCEGIGGPIGICLEQLAPEQKIYTITLTCAQGHESAATPTGGSQPQTEPTRIEFAPGATSAQVHGSLDPGGVCSHVLYVMESQGMTVNLYVTTEGVPAGSAILVIWGADGTVLISDHADATTWQGELPSTQDYYIDVKSVIQDPLDYTLEVIIPPLANTPEERGRPREVPPEFQSVVQTLELAGVPPMLPPEFPVDEGLPPIHPYLYTNESGEYELSLDFGADCQGAGACHYGSLTGKEADSGKPVGTQSFPFESEKAQKVTLANGIEGYFIESVCGANCSDAKVFWIYNGFQYMVGLKGGPQSDVVDLANAAITNFVP